VCVCICGGGCQGRWRWWPVWDGGGQRKGQNVDHSFSGSVGGGSGQRKTQPPKMSAYARFQVVWMVAVARGWPNHQKRAVMLVFRGVGDGSGHSKTQPTTTSVTVCFGGVGGGSGQRKAQPPKTSVTSSFSVVVVARGKSNAQK